MSTPAIVAIKGLYPEAALWIMTTSLSADLVRRDPLLDGVLALDKRKSDAGHLNYWKTREMNRLSILIPYPVA